MPSEEDSATATGNMHKNLVKFGRVVFELCERTDTDRQMQKQTRKQTNKQTYSLQYFATLLGLN